MYKKKLKYQSKMNRSITRRDLVGGILIKADTDIYNDDEAK